MTVGSQWQNVNSFLGQNISLISRAPGRTTACSVPATGATIQIAASTKISFQPAKELKESV
jgi:hypothetical protein